MQDGKDDRESFGECSQEFEVFPCVVKRGNGRYCSSSCFMINQRKRGLYCQTPNKAEGKLISLFESNDLPFRYTGNGEVWFGNRNPDFINTNGKKQVIELLGTYWHPLFDGADRVEHYKQYGFSCLAVWEDELQDEDKVIKRVKKFANTR